MTNRPEPFRSFNMAVDGELDRRGTGTLGGDGIGDDEISKIGRTRLGFSVMATGLRTGLLDAHERTVIPFSLDDRREFSLIGGFDPDPLAGGEDHIGTIPFRPVEAQFAATGVPMMDMEFQEVSSVGGDEVHP